LYSRNGNKEFLIQEKLRESVFLETGGREWGTKKGWDWELLFCKEFAPKEQFVSEESV